jgi:hypothetical protein
VVGEGRLPFVPRPIHIARGTAIWALVTAVALLTLDFGWRGAIINSLNGTLLVLSFVLITGLVGQVSLAQLALAGVAGFGDLDALTIFADNLVPHVLRCEGVLVYDPRLAAHIDAGRLVRPGPQEREIRGCAVHACALIAGRTGMTERDIDNALWYRGQRPEYKARPRHRTRTVYY